MQNEPQITPAQITCSCSSFKKSQWCKHMPPGAVKTGWNKPQLSAIEEMALKYNIPLADLESLLATALEEQKQEFMAKIDLIINQSKEHSCRFNDGDSNCECYLEGLNRVKRQLGYEQTVSTHCNHEGDKNNFHPQFCNKCGMEFMYDILNGKDK